MFKHSFRSLPVMRAAAGLMLLGAAGAGQAISVDGNLSDWGLTFSGAATDWNTSNPGVLSVVDDQAGGGGAFLGPGWGGQAYDAEALYMTWNSSTLYLAMVTGHSPQTQQKPSQNSYGRGDFAFDFNLDGTWDFGFATDNRGSTIKKGTLYQTTDGNWSYGLWSSDGVLGPSTDATALKGGTAAALGQLLISGPKTNMGALGGKHWIYEVAIPVAGFGALWDAQGPKKSFDVTWTMLCANDILRLDPPLRSVPVPGTAGLAMAGLAGLGLLRRRSLRNPGWTGSDLY